MKTTNKEPLGHLKSRSVSAEYLEAAEEFAAATQELTNTLEKLDTFMETKDAARFVTFDVFGEDPLRTVVKFSPAMEQVFTELIETYRILTIKSLENARERLNKAAQAT